MDTADKNFSPQESLLLIQSMINKTKENLGQGGFHLLLWGWLTFAAILGQYVLKVIFNYRHHYIVFLLTFIGIGVSLMYSRKRKEKYVRTYVGESMKNLWIGLGISFFILSFLFANIEGGWFFCYPFFILLYGLGTFVSGMILRFRPLIIGGIFNWILSMASVFFDFDNQMLFAAAALLTSYIIPGHLLSSKKYHDKK
jgi:hypothetical protein